MAKPPPIFVRYHNSLLSVLTPESISSTCHVHLQMPEGHTIHRIARDHSRDFVGETVAVFSPQGRFLEGAKILSGRLLQHVEAHGKHLFYHWQGQQILHIHLGLYGKFRSHRIPMPEPLGQVRLRVIGSKKGFDLRGPTACELLTMGEYEALRRRLGPDPLQQRQPPDEFLTRLERSPTAIGALLLNQKVISGVGNVYRCEILHLLRVHPDRPARELSRNEMERLWSLLHQLMKIGVRYNRIIIPDPKRRGKPYGRMTREERLLVYKRQRCRDCQREISNWVLGARKIYACRFCQR